MKKVFLALSFLLAVGTAAAQAGPDWVATANGAVVSMPPVALTDGTIGHVAWSPDGENLLVTEQPNVVTQEQVVLSGIGSVLGPVRIMAWDRRFQRVRTLWTADDADTTVENIAWLPSSTAAYLTLRWTVKDPKGAQQPRYGVMWLDTASGNFKWVAGLEQLVTRPKIVASPTRPLAVIQFSDNPADDNNGQQSYTITSGANGNVSISFVVEATQIALDNTVKPILNSVFVNSDLPKVNNFWTVAADGSVKHSIKTEKMFALQIEWNQDGSAWFLRDTDPKTKKPGLYRLTDQGELVATDEVGFVTTPKTPILGIDQKQTQIEIGKTKTSISVALLKSLAPSDHSEFMLTTNASWTELSPTEGAVFYVDGGVAKVRSLITLTKAQMKTLQDAEKLRASVQLDGAELNKVFSTIRFTLSGSTVRTKDVP